MKKKELDEIKSKSISELKNKISQLEKEKVNAILELKMAKVKNVHIVKHIKKDIAKAKTILNLKLFLERSQAMANKPEDKEKENAAN